MNTASSASDRIEKVRALLAEWDRAATPDEHGLHDGGGFAMRNNHRLREALREMVSPASVDETPEQVADEWATKLLENGLVATFGFERVASPEHYPLHRDSYLMGVQRGIVMGWNSWEPETAPGLPSGDIEQVIADGKAALDRVEASGESDRMDDVFDARDEAARWIAQVIELLEGQS